MTEVKQDCCIWKTWTETAYLLFPRLTKFQKPSKENGAMKVFKVLRLREKLLDHISYKPRKGILTDLSAFNNGFPYVEVAVYDSTNISRRKKYSERATSRHSVRMSLLKDSRAAKISQPLRPLYVFSLSRESSLKCLILRPLSYLNKMKGLSITMTPEQSVPPVRWPCSKLPFLTLG